MRSLLKLFFFFSLFLETSFYAQGYAATGTIKGSIYDTDTRLNLIGANVTLVNTLQGAATDLNGNFEIKNVLPGSYSLKFSYIGYHPVTKTDIIIRPERITFVEAELKSFSFQTDSIIVSGGYYDESEIQPNSITNYSYEEIRRAPGSAGDVSRILMSLPSVAKINDQSNSLIVRGGSPIENNFYIDNIEIPNINHFPMVGSSGGPIGLLNVDFIEDVNFYSGGFSSNFGNRLSSIMDIKLREGNRDEYETQIDLSFQAIGGIVEGPIYEGNGSWFLSVRKSYLDILFESVAPSEAMPSYYDSQAKITYNISQNHKISLLNILSIDRQTMTYNKAFDYNKNNYFDINVNMNILGINWQYIWNKSGYSDFSVSHLYWDDNKDFTDTRTRLNRSILKTIEQEVRFINTNHYKINATHKLDFGFESKYLFNKYNNLYSQAIDPLGQDSPELIVQRKMNGYRLAGFINYNWETDNKMILIPGLRISYSDYNNTLHIEPRLAFTYKLDEVSSLSFSYGIYYQSIPTIFLAQNTLFNNLEDPQASHYVISFNHLLTQDTKLTLELYDKEYKKLLIDPSLPQILTYDQSIFESDFDSHKELISAGKAYSRGIEISLQKKLATNFYGLIAGTYYRSRYKDLKNNWRDRIYDNKFSFTIEGGYKLNEQWEFSGRWIYAGGAPYTPFDLNASKAVNDGVYDKYRINGVRLPDYHSLNFRFDRRFHFSSSTLVFYFSVWNAYGRKNLYAYSWNDLKNEPQEEKQWTLIPIFGLEFEF